MKELEKTKRISVSAILFFMIIIIGFLTFKKPKITFVNDSESTLEFITSEDYFLNKKMKNQMDPESYLLIDIRSNFEYLKGHLDDAVNIPQTEILKEQNLKILKAASASKKLLILYGETPVMANNTLILLYQLGFDHLKLLTVNALYKNREFSVEDTSIEKPVYDFELAMKEASKAPVKKIKLIRKSQPEKKKVVTKPKKKKKMPEGGC